MLEIPGSYLVGRQLSTSDNQNNCLQDIKICELTVFRGQLEPWTLRSQTHRMQKEDSRGLGALTFKEQERSVQEGRKA